MWVGKLAQGPLKQMCCPAQLPALVVSSPVHPDLPQTISCSPLTQSGFLIPSGARPHSLNSSNSELCFWFTDFDAIWVQRTVLDQEGHSLIRQKLFSRMTYKWSHRVFSLLCLSAFIYVSEIRPCWYVNEQLVPARCWVVLCRTDTTHSAYQLVNW